MPMNWNFIPVGIGVIRRMCGEQFIGEYGVDSVGNG